MPKTPRKLTAVRTCARACIAGLLLNSFIIAGGSNARRMTNVATTSPAATGQSPSPSPTPPPRPTGITPSKDNTAPQAAQGREAQRRQRQGILSVLYTRRLNESGQPSMSVHELEDLLGCPREHLEFSFWYLKEKNWIARTDNGRYSITANGVEQAEAVEILCPRDDRLLPSAV